MSQGKNLQLVDKNKIPGFGERLKEAFGSLPNVEIAQKLGLSKSAITNYIQDRVPEPETLLLIKELTGCSLHWLLTGEGPKLPPSVSLTDELLKSESDKVALNAELRHIIGEIAEREEKSFDDTLDEVVIEGLAARGEIDNSPSTILHYEHFGEYSHRLIPVRLLGEISAGKPIKVFEEEETVWVAEELVIDERTFVLRVRGDSMVDEGILDGDLIVCLSTPEAHNGQRVIAIIDGEYATLKKYYRTGNLVRLQPANPMYKPLVLPADRVAVQGVVTAIQRRM